MISTAQPVDATAAFLRRYARPGDTVLDIGANVGQSAFVAAEVVGPSGKVYSFEPNPATFAALKAAVSHLPNVKAVPVALCEHAGISDFYIDTREEHTSVASSLRELSDLARAGRSQKTVVECSTLDLYCTVHGLRPNVIKIDVESAEPRVIAGGRKTILAYRPTMLFEFWECLWEEPGYREMFEYLSTYYRLTRIQDGAAVEQLYYQQKCRGNVDILCVRR